MAAIINSLFGNTPKKPSRERANGAASPRSLKRQAKRDPYDDMDDDDDVIPARKTPATQRTARSRLSSVAGTPASSSRPRSSLSGKRSASRASLKSHKGDVAPDTTAAIEASPARARGTHNLASPSDHRVPEAPMGGFDFPATRVADPSNSIDPQLNAATVQESPAGDEGKGRGRAKGKEKTKQNESIPMRSAEPVNPAVPAKPTQAEPEEMEENDEDDNREEREISGLLGHRMSTDGDGVVELLVQWAGERQSDATWEYEDEIQHGAAETLYEYWKDQGGRIHTLFHKPKNPPNESYLVFKVLRHEKKSRGGFQFEVQWVGHPAINSETTMEAEAKLKNIAPGLLEEYWENAGGRHKYLAPRGRAAKKARTE
ncbi:hypothetical protein F4808DRAFT_343419 [Astrocystis sublimbata]|nr:hypothetical protein F4808DRAFT_343419 [Astrocystis sublimbata]